MHNQKGCRAFGALLAALLVAATAAQAQPAFRGASGASTAPTFRSASQATYAGISFRAAASAATDTSSLSIGLPSGTLENDVMIAAIGFRPSSVTVTAPTGWTLVRRVDNSDQQTNSLAVYRKVAGSSEASSHTWDVTGASYAVGGIQSFGGVDTANPIDVENGQATAESLSHAAPSVTTTVANAMVVTAHTFTTSTTWSPPSAMTEGFDVQFSPVDPGLGQSISAHYVQQTATGATGTKTATAAGSSGDEDPGNTHTLALRPASPVVTIVKPAGLSENDVMIAAIGFRPESATLTAPSGWTLVRRTNNTGTNGGKNGLAVYRKLAGTSEPASYAWQVDGAFGAAGGIQAFFNVDMATPVNVENGQATANSLSHATPSVTTTVGNTMLVTAHTYASATPWTPPSGMTEAVDAMAGGQSLTTSHVLQPAATSTGSKTATANGSAGDADQGVTHILALRPTDPPLTLAKPAGVVANDVMIAAIGFRPASASLTVPDGWTLVRRTDNAVSGASNSLAVYRKVAGSSEPDSYVWNLSGDTYTVGGIQAFSGVDTSNPIDVEDGHTTPYGLSHATPSVTTTVANAMIVTAHTFETATTWTPPSGMTEGFDTKFGGQSIEGNYVLQATAGATGTKTATAAGSTGDQDEGVTHILALRPATTVAQLYFIHVDHLNTPRLVADATGTTVWRWDQAEPFGNNPADEDPDANSIAFDLPLRLPGQRYDAETGLHYNYYRNYDPNIGRYEESDPIGLRGGLNTYAYVHNDAIGRSDPSGLKVRLICRPLEGPIVRKIFDHCFVHVSCPQEGWQRTLSLLGTYPYISATGYKVRSPDPLSPDHPGAPQNTYDEEIVPIVRPGSCSCDYEKSVVQRFDAAPPSQPYQAFGYNSNSFASDLIISTEFGTKVPGNAPTMAIGLRR